MSVKSPRYAFKCISCNSVLDDGVFHTRCPRCGGLVIIDYVEAYFRVDRVGKGIWRYSSLLPGMRVRISMNEGLTPITKVNDVLVKNERYNPTGSYADRASALIASYLKSQGIRCVCTRYVRDYTRSLVFYLTSNNISIWIEHQDLAEIDPNDLFYYVTRDVHIAEHIPRDCHVIEYVNPLNIEGLKTIVFELFERDIRPDYLVVPTTTGLLAYSLAKGLADLSKAGIDYSFKIVAVVLKAHYDQVLEFVKHEKNITIEKASISEAYESMRELVKKGFKINPLGALGYLVAKTLKNSIGVLTMGYRSSGRVDASSVRKIITETLEKHGSLSAYEIWRLNPQYTLRAYYKVAGVMEKKGELCFDYILKGKRRVKKYYLC